MQPPLSQLLNEQVISELKVKIANQVFPAIDLKLAMQFILSDGIIPASDLPVQSFLMLEDWLRDESGRTLSFTATELKNKTGVILEKVLQGHRVQIIKHGRAIVEMRSCKS